MEEVYKDIPDYKGLYQVSNLGNVKSLKFNKERVLKLCLNSSGYKIVGLRKDSKSRSLCVHQLVAVSFLGHKACGHRLVVDHKNNDKLDNRVENLQVITQRKNTSRGNRGSSKYTGVHWLTSRKKWRAEITIEGKRIYLGLFKEEYSAHLAYQKALKEHLATDKQR